MLLSSFNFLTVDERSIYVLFMSGTSPWIRWAAPLAIGVVLLSNNGSVILEFDLSISLLLDLLFLSSSILLVSVLLTDKLLEKLSDVISISESELLLKLNVATHSPRSSLLSKFKSLVIH